MLYCAKDACFILCAHRLFPDFFMHSSQTGLCMFTISCELVDKLSITCYLSLENITCYAGIAAKGDTTL